MQVIWLKWDQNTIKSCLWKKSCSIVNVLYVCVCIQKVLNVFTSGIIHRYFSKGVKNSVLVCPNSMLQYAINIFEFVLHLFKMTFITESSLLLCNLNWNASLHSLNTVQLFSHYPLGGNTCSLNTCDLLAMR